MKYINHLHPIFESGLRQHAEYEVRLRFWVAQSWLSPFSLFFCLYFFPDLQRGDTGTRRHVPVCRPRHRRQVQHIRRNHLDQLAGVCASCPFGVPPSACVLCSPRSCLRQNPDLNRNVKPALLAVFGDIALAIGGQFQRFIVYATTALEQAMDITVPADDEDLMDFLQSLRVSILEALTGIVHGFCSEPGKGAWWGADAHACVHASAHRPFFPVPRRRVPAASARRRQAFEQNCGPVHGP